MTKKRPATVKRRRPREHGELVKTAPLHPRQSTKPKDPVTKALKADFDATHAEGMRALNERDFERLGQAIERERRLIGQQEKRIATQRAKQSARGK